jgi:hypothetical protein
MNLLSRTVSLLGMALAIGCSPRLAVAAPAATAVLNFSDLGSHAADQPAIARIVAQGIMSPVSPGAFEPDAPVSRGDFVVSIQHMLTLKAPAQPPVFGDVPPTNKVHGALAATAPYMNRQLLCVGYVLGTNFQADEPIGRGLVAITLVNALIARKQIELVTVADADKALTNVADANLLSAPARQYLATALTNGIPTLRPGNEIAAGSAMTRDEFAVMLDRVQQNFKIAPIRPTTSPAPK